MTFYPPDALIRLREWRDQNAGALARVPDESIRIDIGRADGGAFARVKVAETYADYFAQDP